MITTDKLKIITSLTLVYVGALMPLFAQEAPLKDFAEARNERKFCFYPSTLRMVNLEQNPELNEVVNCIKKVLIYQLSGSAGDEDFKEMVRKYRSNGFEEYVRVFGGDQNILILGKGNDQYVGYFTADQSQFAFYMDGEVKWEKIPVLMDKVQSSQLLNFFEVEGVEIDD